MIISYFSDIIKIDYYTGDDAMLKIALCDDDVDQIDKIKEYILEYFKTDVNLTVFTNSQMLLDRVEWSGKELFDLYILDVIMPELSGIELGLQLRGMDVCAPIIYLTSSKDYAVESYSVHALHYLVKPVEKEKLFSAIKQAEILTARLKAHSITVNTSDGTVVINTSDILYAELYERSVRYNLINETVVDSQKLRISFQKAVGELLERDNFIMLGSSFLINLHYIKKVGKKELILTNEKSLAIPKGARNDILNKWMDYWMEE